MKPLLLLLAAASIATCASSPFLFFWGAATEAGYKSLLAGASVAWFVFATLYATRR